MICQIRGICVTYTKKFIQLRKQIIQSNTKMGKGPEQTFGGLYRMTQTARNLPAMQESWVGSLGQDNTLEKEMEPHSSIFAWKIPWTEESGGLQFMGSQRVGHSWTTNTQMHTQKGNACQQMHEKMLHITNHPGNENQNHNEVSPHTYQDSYYQKGCK